MHITPSSLGEFAFCPQKFYYKKTLRKRESLKRIILKLIGKIMHLLYRKRGFEREKLMSAEIGDVVLIGKPDMFRVEEDFVEVVELKVKKMPKKANEHGLRIWNSDLVQVLAYGLMLEKIYGRGVRLKIKYVDGEVEVPFMKDVAFEYINEYVDVFKNGKEPRKIRDGRCKRCEYREIC